MHAPSVASTCSTELIELALGDPLARRICAWLLKAGAERKRTDIRDFLARHATKDDVERALQLLLQAGLAQRRWQRTRGRRAELWSATALAETALERELCPASIAGVKSAAMGGGTSVAAEDRRQREAAAPTDPIADLAQRAAALVEETISDEPCAAADGGHARFDAELETLLDEVRCRVRLRCRCLPSSTSSNGGLSNAGTSGGESAEDEPDA